MNGPVWILLLLSFIILILGISTAASRSVWLSIGLGIFFWQLLCAGIMLLIDYPRKQRILKRLIQNSRLAENADRILKPLRHTICGIFLAWAVESAQKNG